MWKEAIRIIVVAWDLFHSVCTFAHMHYLNDPLPDHSKKQEDVRKESNAHWHLKEEQLKNFRVNLRMKGEETHYS